MTEMIKPASECTNMAEVRAAIDALDREIVPMIAKRVRYIEAAGRIKNDRNKVHDDARIEDVVQKALAVAATCDAPASIIEATYRAMIAACIAYEFTVFDTRSQKREQV